MTDTLTPFIGDAEKADKATVVSAAGLAVGGGDLSANRAIAVLKASAAEAAAGVIDDKVVTPLSIAATLAALQAQLDALQVQVDDILTVVSPDMATAQIIISHGQSLALRQPPRVTVGITVENYLQPVGGNFTEQFPNFTGNSDQLQKMDNLDSFVPFQEHADGESWGAGLGYQFRQNAANGQMIFYTPATGARHWRELRPGTSRWGNMLAFVHRASEHFREAGLVNVNVRFFWTHGEADSDTIAPGGSAELIATAAEMQQIQENLLRFYQRDMKLVFGRDMSHLPIYVTPMNSAVYQDITLSAVSTDPARGGASRKTQAGQLAAALANPKIVLLPPHYQFWTHMNGDGVHLLGGGRRLHAELCASVAERVEGGAAYKPPYVMSATRTGAVITANCHFPGGGGGVRDTTTFGEPSLNWSNSKYGVQFWDDTTAAWINVIDADISGSTLTVMLASTPAGAGDLRIAQQPWPIVGVRTTDWTARSNFRDATLSVTAQDGTVLYHYMLPQTVRVT